MNYLAVPIVLTEKVIIAISIAVICLILPHYC